MDGEGLCRSGGAWRKAFARIAVVLSLAAFGCASGQDDATTTLRDLLERGFYNAAVQLEGPKLIAAEPDNPDAHFLFAKAAWLTGDVEAAREALTTATRLYTADGEAPPDAVFHLDGLLLNAEGDADRSMEALRNAFERSGTYRFAMDWGRVAWQAGQLGEALDAYAAAANTYEGAREPWPHLNQGRILARTERWPEARAAFERSIEVFEAQDAGEPGLPSPAYAEAFFRIGETYEAEGDLARAETSFKAARSIDPNYLPVIRALDRLAQARTEP